MAEEQRLQEGHRHRLCANNCGFFGSPATNDLCSKCFRDLRLKEERASSAKIAVEKSLLPSSSSAPPAAPFVARAAEAVAPPPPPPAAAAAEEEERRPGRCTAAACRRRVGLTGFRCRCGETFCGAHRYPEQHACTFDFKEAGREEIARANPVVKADKLGGRI